MVFCLTHLTFICQNIDLGTKVFQALVKSSILFYLILEKQYLTMLNLDHHRFQRKKDIILAKTLF